MLCGLCGLPAASGQAPEKLSGRVKVDGSSTVAPIMMAAAEMFRAEQPRVDVAVGIAGTGGGFKKFLEERRELRTDINDASRAIKAPEMARAAQLGVEFIELPIAYDGIAIAVNASNSFCDSLTVAELKRIWEPDSPINNWKDVRLGFPDLRLKLYGPAPDNGTFDYFTEAVVGKEDASRSDYTASVDSNVRVQGVAGDPGGLGYFGFSYYEANRDRLKLLAIDNGDGKPIKPSLPAIRDGTYRPLSRPLFIYVNKEAAQRPEVRAFLQFLFANAPRIVENPKVGYAALPADLYRAIWSRLEQGVAGSAFADPNAAGRTLPELFSGQKK
jgi:phosphate transport system substrate-binding protein